LTTDQSFLGYFFAASGVVKIVMLILLALSLMSWAIIFQRGMLIKQCKSVIGTFERRFWSGIELAKLFQELEGKSLIGVPALYFAGFREYLRLRPAPMEPQSLIDGVQRAMRIAYTKEMIRLEKDLSFLATVGSISPYIGLFGTVWGIMTSFHSLSQAGQATIAMVAPGISEALIATAMGLFAAIPAGIGYNRYQYSIQTLHDQFEIFQDEFAGLLFRQLSNPQAIRSPQRAALTE
jgi:biopolymer transport protein TolQ